MLITMWIISRLQLINNCALIIYSAKLYQYVIIQHIKLLINLSTILLAFNKFITFTNTGILIT